MAIYKNFEAYREANPSVDFVDGLEITLSDGYLFTEVSSLLSYLEEKNYSSVFHNNKIYILVSSLERKTVKAVVFDYLKGFLEDVSYFKKVFKEAKPTVSSKNRFKALRKCITRHTR